MEEGKGRGGGNQWREKWGKDKSSPSLGSSSFSSWSPGCGQECLGWRSTSHTLIFQQRIVPCAQQDREFSISASETSEHLFLISQLCLAGTPAQDCSTWGTEFPNPVLQFCSFPSFVGSVQVWPTHPLPRRFCGFSQRQTVGKLQIQGIFHLWESGRGIMQSEWKLWFWGFWLQHKESK